MSSPYAKRRRITPWSTVSAGAMGSAFNKKQAVAVRKLSRRVKLLERTEETKYFDTDLDFTIDSTAETAVPSVNLIATGDTSVNRDGYHTMCKNLQIRAAVTHLPAASVTGSSSVVHIWVVLDRQSNGAAPVFADVFSSTVGRACMRNLDNINRFKILEHWKHAFTPAAGATTAYCQTATCWETYIKLKGLQIDFDAATSAITSVTGNNICILAGSDGNSDDVVGVQGTARLTFTS